MGVQGDYSGGARFDVVCVVALFITFISLVTLISNVSIVAFVADVAVVAVVTFVSLVTCILLTCCPHLHGMIYPGGGKQFSVWGPCNRHDVACVATIGNYFW